jgi:hypothetical protein
MTSLLASPCSYLRRDDATHTYLDAQGRPVPISVTGVLAASDSPHKRRILEETRPQWEARGNACHRALELWITSGRTWLPSPGCPTFSPFIPWILPLTTWAGWNGLTFTASELLLHHPELGIAGQFDGAWRTTSGHRVLFDLKSRGHRDAGTYSTAAQLGGYIVLAARWGIHFDHAATVWARPNRYPTLSTYTIGQCLAAWARAWAFYREQLTCPRITL